jgi:maleate cis-trans isomerase
MVDVSRTPKLKMPLRIGLIIPTSNRLSEPQFHRYAPEGVAIHTTRLRMTGPYESSLTELLPRAVAAAELLGDAKCDIIVFHCTGSSMRDGIEAEQKVIDAIQKATGRLATSTASALLAALEAMDARKIVLTAPYSEEGLEAERRFIESAGYEVLHGRAVGLNGSDGFVAEPSETWVQVAIEEQDPRADLMLMACTNLHTTDVIQEMEAAIGRPVLTSNQSTLWYCLRRLGRNDDIPELGQLFKLPLKAGNEKAGTPWSALVGSAMAS